MKTKPATTNPLQQVATLRSELKETYQQLQLGSTTNVRRPKALRKQIARLLTKHRQAELAKQEQSS